MPSVVRPEADALELPGSPDSGAATPFVAVETPRNDAAWQAVPPPLVVAASDDTKPVDASSKGSTAAATTPPPPPPPRPFKFRELYRYASPVDYVALSLGLAMTAVNGALFPCMALIFGEAISSFQPYDADRVATASLYYLGVACLLFVTDYGAYVLFHVTAERQMKALRAQGFHHMLHLDITWYDRHDALQLSSRLTGDTVKIKDGLGQKLGDALRFVAQFVAGYVIGFSKGWQLSLVMASIMPCLAVSMAFLLSTMRTRTEFAQKVYAEAGAVAEETLGSMRTVVSNNGERRAIDKYNAKALKAEEENISLARVTSGVLGVFFASMWFMYAAGLWYGGGRVAANKTDPGSVFSAFFGVLLGTMAMAQISPNISAVAQAKGAAAALYAILDTPSMVDASRASEGIIPPDGQCRGEIEAIGVEFFYPSRPDVTILKNYNVRVAAGQTVAFVGASGGGKSTLIALLERFYDPSKGQLLLDGRDIKTLNITWLRRQIGLVSQEPVLFATSILENIRFGRENVTREQAVEAAKMANAHEFIMRLPQQYDTLVGEKGVSLSGGQKQRVAIARAVVRNPKILVLDEATSALDNESERVVQAALNALMAKTSMTTLVIAHRLSTIRHVDKIVVLSGGAVVEQGTHDVLMAVDRGVYRNLYTIQAGNEVEDDAEDAEETQAASVVPLDTRTGSGTGLQASLGRQASDSGMEIVPLNKEDHDSRPPSFTMRKAITLASPERKYFIAGCLGSAVVGTSMPGSAILISGLVSSMTEKYMLFQQTQQQVHLDELSDQVTIYGSFYIGGAFVLMAATAVQTYCFKFMAEKLTSRLRDMNFSALCRQDIAFFDDLTHATGALTADLATNATKVALLSGDAQGRVVQALCTFTAAIVISFTLGSWLLTLVMLAVFPLLILGHLIRMRQMKGGGGGSDFLGESGAHASQALSNIRTVVSLGLETRMTATYAQLLEAPLRDGTKEAHVNGVALGFSSFIMFAVYALVFWYGGRLVGDGEISFEQLMRTLMAIMMSAQGIGSAASWLADSGNATRAGSAIFDLVERTLTIDAFDEGGVRLDKVDGRIEFKDITFRYPTRPNVPVLRHYNLMINAGQTVAFCGPSGGGKSTCISLLERFYDPVKGQVLLDGHDLKTLHLRWLRQQIGLVGQEPTLFIGTISENIAYGLETMPSQEEIQVAAKMANAHAFISQFPDGYDTQVGMKGEKLSGGQKQRIAIARAILKNPSILLLDEATSALDSESEKIVQEALDKVVALKKRTTIIIAHRLSTIRKADKICVVSGGKIAEQGTHAELLAKNGIYKRLAAKE